MARGKSVEAALDKDVGTVEVPLEGVVKRPDQIQEVEPYGDVFSLNDKAQKLKFMEEPVEIFLHEAQSASEEPAVFLSVNGEPALPHQPWLPRGRQYTLKRKFVEVLARSRPVNYTQPNKTDNREEVVNRFQARTTLRYPFSVQNDTPQGQKWLRALMAA